MNLQCDLLLGSGYKSGSQQSRVISEGWCRNNLYCPACPSTNLKDTPKNFKAVDFVCQRCHSNYQLKSAKTKLGNKVLDSAYSVMMERVEAGTMPHLLALRYDASWKISTLLLIPGFFFTASAIEERNALGPSAQRAGYVGCNILLSHIPSSGRIPIIQDCTVVPPNRVRKAFQALGRLKEIKPGREARGWTLDVLRIVEGLAKRQFTLDEVYAFERELSQLHPANKNVRPKIRQQLQVLRDLGKLRFTSSGHYESVLAE
jgi:type II restriction enzyme